MKNTTAVAEQETEMHDDGKGGTQVVVSTTGNLGKEVPRCGNMMTGHLALERCDKLGSK